LASCLGDQGRFSEGLEVLAKGGATKTLRNPAYRHVRMWYALGDLYDRSGDLGGAREYFTRVVKADIDAYDAKQRLEELGAVTVRKNRKKRVVPVSRKKNVD
jgi:tetratricopeptide (TPR) repeat protein